MRRFLLAALALVAFSVLATVAHAQDFDNEPLDQQASAEQRFSDDIARWTRVLDRVGEQLGDNNLNSAILDKLRATVSDVQGRLEDARIPVLADCRPVQESRGCARTGAQGRRAAGIRRDYFAA